MTLKIIWKKIKVSTETCRRFLLMSLFVNLRLYFARSRSYFHSFLAFCIGSYTTVRTLSSVSARQKIRRILDKIMRIATKYGRKD